MSGELIAIIILSLGMFGVYLLTAKPGRRSDTHPSENEHAASGGPAGHEGKIMRGSDSSYGDGGD